MDLDLGVGSLYRPGSGPGSGCGPGSRPKKHKGPVGVLVVLTRTLKKTQCHVFCIVSLKSCYLA